MDVKNYNETKLNKALDRVIVRRLEAQKKYGDKWLEDSIDELEAMLFMKTRRVRDAKIRDAYEDSLLDLIIYSLFIYERQLRGIGKFK